MAGGSSCPGRGGAPTPLDSHALTTVSGGGSGGVGEIVGIGGRGGDVVTNICEYHSQILLALIPHYSLFVVFLFSDPANNSSRRGPSLMEALQDIQGRSTPCLAPNMRGITLQGINDAHVSRGAGEQFLEISMRDLSRRIPIRHRYFG
jgi:hypothetical protein